MACSGEMRRVAISGSSAKATAIHTPTPMPVSTAGRLSAVSTSTGSRSASSRGSTHCTASPIAVPSAAPISPITPAWRR